MAQSASFPLSSDAEPTSPVAAAAAGSGSSAFPLRPRDLRPAKSHVAKSTSFSLLSSTASPPFPNPGASTLFLPSAAARSFTGPSSVKKGLRSSSLSIALSAAVASVPSHSPPRAAPSRPFAGESRADAGYPVFSRCANPFDPSPPWTTYEGFKLCLSLLTLLPLRLLILLFSLVLVLLFLCLASLQPFPAYRRALVQPTRLCARLILFAFGFWWIPSPKKKVSESENASRVLVCNHTSPFDILYFYYFYLPSFLANHTVKGLPVIGRAACLLDCLFVDRRSAESKREVAEKIKQRASDSRAPPLLIFPEGTTTNGSVLISFKKGAFEPGVPVTPVILRYPFKHFNMAHTSSHDTQQPLNMLRAMTQFSNSIECTILPDYVPSLTPGERGIAAESTDAPLFANNVRAVMAQAMDVPTTEHSYEDLFLARTATEKRILQVFTYKALRSSFPSLQSLEMIKRAMIAFSFLDRDMDGLLQPQCLWPQGKEQYWHSLIYALVGSLVIPGKSEDAVGGLDFLAFLHLLWLTHHDVPEAKKMAYLNAWIYDHSTKERGAPLMLDLCSDFIIPVADGSTAAEEPNREVNSPQTHFVEDNTMRGVEKGLRFDKNSCDEALQSLGEGLQDAWETQMTNERKQWEKEKLPSSVHAILSIDIDP